MVPGGLKTLTDDATYHLHSNFTPFSNIGKTLTLQYTLKTTRSIWCSGNGPTVYSTYPNSYFWFGPVTCDVVLVLVVVVDVDDFADSDSDHPSGPGLFQFSGINGIGFWFKQDQAGSIFDDILLTTS